MIAALVLIAALGWPGTPQTWQLPQTTWRCIGIRSNRGRWLYAE